MTLGNPLTARGLLSEGLLAPPCVPLVNGVVLALILVAVSKGGDRDSDFAYSAC